MYISFVYKLTTVCRYMKNIHDFKQIFEHLTSMFPNIVFKRLWVKFRVNVSLIWF